VGILVAWLLVGTAAALEAQTGQKPPDNASAAQKASPKTQRPIPTLNAQLVAFCKARLGQTVGRGECSDLAVQGLAAAGAYSRGRDYPNTGDYVWGTFVCSVEALNGQHVTQIGQVADNGRVLPGDVIQFRDAQFAGKTPNGTYWINLPHHTAVVEHISEDGLYCQVLEQNSNGRRFVVESNLYIPDLRRGWLRCYRPAGPHSETQEPTEPVIAPTPPTDDKPIAIPTDSAAPSRSVPLQPVKLAAPRLATRKVKPLAKGHHKPTTKRRTVKHHKPTS
jgi:hypothetical protein